MLACAPERGSKTPTLSGPPCARTIAGVARRVAVAAEPASRARRLTLDFRMSVIEFLPGRFLSDGRVRRARRASGIAVVRPRVDLPRIEISRSSPIAHHCDLDRTP